MMRMILRLIALSMRLEIVDGSELVPEGGELLIRNKKFMPRFS